VVNVAPDLVTQSDEFALLEVKTTSLLSGYIEVDDHTALSLKVNVVFSAKSTMVTVERS
jgi:hypothetical protein